jgi:hypothetical protein
MERVADALELPRSRRSSLMERRADSHRPSVAQSERAINPSRPCKFFICE